MLLQITPNPVHLRLSILRQLTYHPFGFRTCCSSAAHSPDALRTPHSAFFPPATGERHPYDWSDPNGCLTGVQDRRYCSTPSIRGTSPHHMSRASSPSQEHRPKRKDGEQRGDRGTYPTVAEHLYDHCRFHRHCVV